MYEKLLKAYQSAGYVASTYHDFVQAEPANRTVVLRHDVDVRPLNSLATAKLESSLGMCGTYYFRIVPGVLNPSIIRQIADLGHEIGYHYEDLAIHRGNREKAIKHFKEKLALLREYYPVTTACMHGSPISKWDNRDIWNAADYHDFGIIGEPYFDTDFTRVFYVTDTGRSWNKTGVSVRDKVRSSFEFDFDTTSEMIRLIESGGFPHLVLQNIHPQRWVGNTIAWARELVLQTAKNELKRWLFVRRTDGSSRCPSEGFIREYAENQVD